MEFDPAHSFVQWLTLSCHFQVTYDLNEMDAVDVFQFRDSLVTALETYHAGPRTIMIQLCLAISGLALQLPAWEDPVQNMIDQFGRNPATVPVLLEFLTVLPEELNSNTKIPVTVSLSITLVSHILCWPSCQYEGRRVQGESE